MNSGLAAPEPTVTAMVTLLPLESSTVIVADPTVTPCIVSTLPVATSRLAVATAVLLLLVKYGAPPPATVKLAVPLGPTPTTTGTLSGAVVNSGFAEPTLTLMLTSAPAVSRTVIVAAPVALPVIVSVVPVIDAMATPELVLLGVR